MTTIASDITLSGWIERFRLKYGIANRFCIPSVSDLCLHLIDATANQLFESVVRQRGERTPEMALANVFGWTVAFVEYQGDLPLEYALWRKWGANHCFGCGQRVCTCKLQRSSSESPAYLTDWQDTSSYPFGSQTILQWQELLDRMFGESNRQQGIQFCLLRLSSEVGEAAKIIRAAMADSSITVGERRKQCALELSDVLAWTFSVANVLGINLGEALLEIYGGDCERCSKFLCDCGFFREQQYTRRPYSPLTLDVETR